MEILVLFLIKWQVSSFTVYCVNSGFLVDVLYSVELGPSIP